VARGRTFCTAQPVLSFTGDALARAIRTLRNLKLFDRVYPRHRPQAKKKSGTRRGEVTVGGKAHVSPVLCCREQSEATRRARRSACRKWLEHACVQKRSGCRERRRAAESEPSGELLCPERGLFCEMKSDVRSLFYRCAESADATRRLAGSRQCGQARRNPAHHGEP